MPDSGLGFQVEVLKTFQVFTLRSEAESWVPGGVQWVQDGFLRGVRGAVLALVVRQ